MAHTHTHSHLRHVQSLFRLLLLYLKRDQIDFNSRSIQNRFAKSPIGDEDRGQLVAVGSLNFRRTSGAHAVSVSLLRIMLNLEVTTTIVCPAEICVKFVILSVYHLFPKVLTRKPQLCSLYSASRRKSDQNHPIDTLFIHNYARKWSYSRSLPRANKKWCQMWILARDCSLELNYSQQTRVSRHTHMV